MESTLRDISWNVPDGCLVAVVGIVGSGKSSLLSSLLGDMIKVKGDANIRGKNQNSESAKVKPNLSRQFLIKNLNFQGGYRV